jgi:DNA-binding SARP family transcriptional activator
MQFRILGPLEILDGDNWRGIGAAKWRSLWALMLLDAGQIVSLDRIIWELWGDTPPKTSSNLVHGYVAQLRKLLKGDRSQLLITRKPGYQLVVDPDNIDAGIFDALADLGSSALRAGDMWQASAHLTEALALWKGRALADVAETPRMQAEASRLEEQRLAVLEARIDADLACGNHAALVPELYALTDEFPMRETLWGQLMIALYRCGRHAEALVLYQQVKRRLADELGIDPSADLQRLELAILRNEVDLVPPASPAQTERPNQIPVVRLPTGPSTFTTADAELALAHQNELLSAELSNDLENPELGTPRKPEQPAPATDQPRYHNPRPAQLPTDLSTFTGRATELDQLLALRPADGQHTSTAVVVGGLAGIGKSALAVHAAHRLAEYYPDGQLFVDLHGHTEGMNPVSPAQALKQMLHALDVPDKQIPREIEARTALYRTHLANRRMLILLDNAHDESQIRPLLPASPDCLVLITSRRRLTGLDDVHPLSLNVLSREEAADLFTRVAGSDRLAGQPVERLEEVVELCGRLPLAVRLAAARLRARPSWTVTDLVERITDRTHRLAELAAGDRSVAAAFHLSYQKLRPDLQRFFRLLGPHPGPDIESHAAAALADISVVTADRLLEELMDAHLLGQHAPGRYQLNDLLRAHAVAACGQGYDSAVDRLLDHYMRTAAIATNLAYPKATDQPVAMPQAMSTVALDTPQQAAAWLDSEHANLLAAADFAAENGRPCHAIALSATVHRHLDVRDHHRRHAPRISVPTEPPATPPIVSTNSVLAGASASLTCKTSTQRQPTSNDRSGPPATSAERKQQDSRRHRETRPPAGRAAGA